MKLYYLTSCYRYEKPQAGRLRELHQFGVEMFGAAEPAADAQIIAVALSAFHRLGLADVGLQLNSIGCPTCRARVPQGAEGVFRPPGRTSCATPASAGWSGIPCGSWTAKARSARPSARARPRSLDYLCEDCRDHFEKVQDYLTAMGIAFDRGSRPSSGAWITTPAPCLSSSLHEPGAQGIVCGGGRYDGLVEEFGGKPTPGLGFGLGLDRILHGCWTPRRWSSPSR